MIGLSGLQRERMEKKARNGNRSTYDHPNNGPDKISHPAILDQQVRLSLRHRWMATIKRVGGLKRWHVRMCRTPPKDIGSQET
jgi:hypothetical protein